MTKILHPKIVGIIIATFAFGTIFAGTSNMNVSADEGVPEWFKGVAGFWAEGNISTAEFLDGIEFLLEQGVISVDGYGLLSEAQAQNVNQDSLDDVWVAISSLQNQVDNISTTGSSGELTIPDDFITSDMIQDGTIQFSHIEPNCPPDNVLKVRDVGGGGKEWYCHVDVTYGPGVYVIIETAKGTAVAECEGTAAGVGGGGIPSEGTTLKQSYPLGTGAFGIPNGSERPSGWVASSSDANADVTAIAVCLV